jgi:hypothetical protein
LKTELKKVKEENLKLKASNDNHIFINEKLNNALQKFIANDSKKKKKKPLLNQPPSDSPNIPSIRDTIPGATGGSTFE